MRKLTVVVTCSDRKTLPVVPGRRLRDVPDGDCDTRVRHWNEQLSSASSVRTLTALYQGDHWSQALRLPAAAAKAGFDAQVWVASAGLGLQPVTASAPAYGATFTARHLDSVAPDVAGRQQWWSALQRHHGVSTLPELARDGSLLLVLSEDYGQALRPEVAEVSDIAGDVLLVGKGGGNASGLVHIAGDRRLRSHLGGTLTSLNVRMARAWLESLTDPVLTSPVARRRWERWVASVAREEVYDRQPLSDEVVRQYIRAQRASVRRPSKTALLRSLRAEGYACEQSRFGLLYAEVEQQERGVTL